MEFVTAGESHGPALTAIVTGVPAGVRIDEDALNADLVRRQGGYGRGGRQKIEHDTVRVLSGVRFSKTLGTPVALEVANADHANWKGRMDVFGEAPTGLSRETHPRPGHADLVGMLKLGSDDARDVLERSSARETAARVAAGGIAKALLRELGVEVRSYVKRIGDVSIGLLDHPDFVAAEAASCRCPDEKANVRMEAAIDAARAAGESLGGEVVVVADGLVPGLGSFASGPERLTSKLGAAAFAIPAIKGVEFGLGFAAAARPGSQVHDGIVYSKELGYGRTGNNAGGLEGGMTTGQPLVMTLAMKPIPTMMKPLDTVDTDTHEPVKASKERSDVCAVPAMGVVAEAEVAFVLAGAYLDKFGADALSDILTARDAYLARIAQA
ncbi:MAG: chorismate synthase [Coriobacteriales bacterium]|jgi:chorismate synthase